MKPDTIRRRERLTFRRHKRVPGLAGVGYPYPSVDIKHNGKVVGIICAPDWMTKRMDWKVRLACVEPIDWKWVTLKQRFRDEESARAWLQENAERIIAIGLYHFDGTLE